MTAPGNRGVPLSQHCLGTVSVLFHSIATMHPTYSTGSV